ncbi:hypothetical protein RB195_014626 [Necator americanus]|uniref:Uncharacterized protein n=1 Tax=Necator americanus TaxID=51031 RepID=A0ABR1E102_NECAM
MKDSLREERRASVGENCYGSEESHAVLRQNSRLASSVEPGQDLFLRRDFSKSTGLPCPPPRRLPTQ